MGVAWMQLAEGCQIYGSRTSMGPLIGPRRSGATGGLDNDLIQFNANPVINLVIAA